MQVHNLDSGRVITLDKAEQFAFIPADDVTPDTSWYATKVQTVTVFKRTNDMPAYFTVAGEQIHAPANVTGEDRFWEPDIHYTDSGPLPPHVRQHVEDIVPVVDRPATVLGGDYRSASWIDGGNHKGQSPSQSDRASQRRARFELLDGQGQTDVLSAHRPSQPERLANGHRDVPELQVPTFEPNSFPQGQIPPPSAFLNNSQVWNRTGGSR